MVQLRSVLLLLAVVVAVSSLQLNRREILRRRHHHHHKTTENPLSTYAYPGTDVTAQPTYVPQGVKNAFEKELTLREILRRRHHHHHTTARPIPLSTVTGGWTGPQWGTTRGGWAARSQRMLEMLKLRNQNQALKKELDQLKGI
ncbi:hypothetical protein AAVH_17065 [Aphelenchoides avenae]|nr:hypothetical protein AAVH_17065 [Aphelenchus avenae]